MYSHTQFFPRGRLDTNRLARNHGRSRPKRVRSGGGDTGNGRKAGSSCPAGIAGVSIAEFVESKKQKLIRPITKCVAAHTASVFGVAVPPAKKPNKVS